MKIVVFADVGPECFDPIDGVTVDQAVEGLVVRRLETGFPAIKVEGILLRLEAED